MLFIATNYRAYDGYFQDDELDTLAWAPSRTIAEYGAAFLKPTFDAANFRPVGHLYFTLMGRAFGLDFPPYMTPILAIHLVNALLLFLLMRKLGIDDWRALAGTAFFTLSASALDAYWKPMYVFDLLCATFSLASILLFAYRRWILSFLAFWCAYKAKELAVMLPVALLAYEYWFGNRRYLPLIPFFAASLSFGLQGLILNPNKDNEYTFRFTPEALATTIPFYAQRFLFLPFSGLALVALAFLRDRRVRFGLLAMLCFLFTLLFLPGRLYEAYAYLPLACAAIALAAAATRLNLKWVGAALLLWFFWNQRNHRIEQRSILALDDRVATYVQQMAQWAEKHPGHRTFIYRGVPDGFHDWGVAGAWKIVNNAPVLRALWYEWPDAAAAMKTETVAYGTWTWDGQQGALTIRINSPGT